MSNAVRTALVRALHATEGYLSGEDLARELKISRPAIWKQIQELKAAGYNIDAVRRKGYKLLSPPLDFTLEEVERLLAVSGPRRKVIFYPQVDSTNAVAFKLARGGDVESGTYIVATRQTQGRGRLGRTWVSLPGGLWCSAIFQPTFLPALSPLVTFAAAVAVCESVRKSTGLTLAIKWPNDLTYGGRKLGGILSEVEQEADKIHFLILGIGLNVNLRLSKLPQPVRSLATSLLKELKHEVSLNELFVNLVASLEKYYGYLTAGKVNLLLDAWRKYDRTLGSEVSLSLPDGTTVTGKALNIEANGALIVEEQNGQRRAFTCGDLTLRFNGSA